MVVALGLAGLAGAALLVLADFSTLYTVSVVTVTKRKVIGHDQHSYGLVVLGGLAAVMALGVARGARPAMLAMLALGLAALGIAIVGDSREVTSTGVLGELYDAAAAKARAGFYLETVGGVALLAAGGLALLLSLPARHARVGEMPLSAPRGGPAPDATPGAEG